MERVIKYDLTTLVGKKVFRVDEVNTRTGVLVAEGFTYDTDKTFSLSATAQSNLHGLRADAALLPYPYSWNTIDDLDEYDIADEADALAFYGAAFGTVAAHRGGGTVLKQAIRAATTMEELDAVIDER